MTIFRKVYNHATLVGYFSRASAVDRRAPNRRDGLLLDLVAEMVRRAGAQFIEVQEGIASCGIESVVLFDDRRGSTLAVSLSKFSTRAVEEKLQESEARYAKEM